MSARLAAVLACCAFALPLAAQEPPAEPERHPRVVAAVWLTMERGSDDVPAEDAADQPEPVGLDAGIGAELFGKTFEQGRLSAAALGGTKSVGPCVSWAWLERQRPVAVGVALVAPYDSGGVYVDEWSVAVVATVGLFNRRQETP